MSIENVEKYADENKTSRTAHILQVMKSTMKLKDFKKAYEAARQQQWFHNPFETTMQDNLKKVNNQGKVTTADFKFSMTMVKKHAIKRPDSLTARIIKGHTSP